MTDRRAAPIVPTELAAPEDSVPLNATNDIRTAIRTLERLALTKIERSALTLLLTRNRALERDIAIYAEDCVKAERRIEEHNKRITYACPTMPCVRWGQCANCPRRYMIKL